MRSSASLYAGGIARLHGFCSFPKEYSGAQAGWCTLAGECMMLRTTLLEYVKAGGAKAHALQKLCQRLPKVFYSCEQGLRPVSS